MIVAEPRRLDQLTDRELSELVALYQALHGHRWPYGPLEEALGGSLREQADRLGVHERQVYRWRDYGLSDDMADRCAIRAGLHPAIVWGTEWDEVGLVDDVPEQLLLEVA